MNYLKLSNFTNITTSITNKLNYITQSSIVTNIKQSSSNLISKISNKNNNNINDNNKQQNIQNIQNIQNVIVQMIPNLYHIPYPHQKYQKQIIKYFQYLIQKKKVQRLIIYNISQYQYNIQQLFSKYTHNQNQTITSKQTQSFKQTSTIFHTNVLNYIETRNICYDYFTTLPVTLMFSIIQDIKNILQHNYYHNEQQQQQNKKQTSIFLHCQDNNSRSSLLLALYLYLTGVYDLPQSILQIQKALLNHTTQNKQNHNTQNTLKSQHIILKNIINFINNPKMINPYPLNLVRIIMNKTLLYDDQKINPQLPYYFLIQIRSYRSISNNSQDSKNNSHVQFRKIYQQPKQNIQQNLQGFSFSFNNKKIILVDDFIIQLKYVQNNKAYPILRTQINTNFILNDGYIRIQSQQMDISNKCKNTQGFFIDFMFKVQNKMYQPISTNKKEEITSQLSKIKIENILKLQQHGISIQNKALMRQISNYQQDNFNKKQDQNKQENIKKLSNSNKKIEIKLQSVVKQKIQQHLQSLMQKKDNEEDFNIVQDEQQQNNLQINKQKSNNSQNNENKDKIQQNQIIKQQNKESSSKQQTKDNHKLDQQTMNKLQKLEQNVSDQQEQQDDQQYFRRLQSQH